ncbi:MAG: hypothetical protein K6G56_05455 [Clostridiales bacterium]|nr:hypothetical protein [Clostridiales bacterium]
MKELIPPVLAFAGGVFTGYINFLITRAALKREASGYAVMPARTLVTAGFITALYFTGRALGLKLAPFLIAGAAGATMGLIVFTLLLTRNRDAKEGDRDG